MTKKKPASKSRASSKKKSSFLSSAPFNTRTLLLLVLFLVLAGFIYVMLSQAATVTRRFPGDPNPKLSGKAYWGSSIGGNGDPVRHEGPTGKSLSVRRTFWSWDNNRTSMITTIKGDLAANRLPYVSTKTPKWSEVAAGQHDVVLDDMLRKIDATGGPVWFTAYHEPEDNAEGLGTGNEKCERDPVNEGLCVGTPADWLAMQKHIRARMTAIGTRNIAFMPTLMAWTFDPGSGRDPERWYEKGIWDSYMVDAYVAKDSGTPVTNTQWVNFVKWAEGKGLPFGLGEWGNNFAITNAGKEMKEYWEWSFANKKDMIAYSYFDSDLNGGKYITGDALTVFQDILKNDTRVQRIKDLGVSTSVTPKPTITSTPVATPAITPKPSVAATPVPASTPAPTPLPVSDTSKPSVPTALKLDLVLTDAAAVSWQPSTDNEAVAGYNVRIDGRSIGKTADTKYYPMNLVANRSYTLTVSAYDAAGNESPQSTQLNITTKNLCFLWWCW